MKLLVLSIVLILIKTSMIFASECMVLDPSDFREENPFHSSILYSLAFRHDDQGVFDEFSSQEIRVHMSSSRTELTEEEKPQIDEKQHLINLFGTTSDGHPNFQTIRALIADHNTSFMIYNPKCSFFDALGYMSESEPETFKNITYMTIALEANKEFDYSENLYNLPAVLNEFMLLTQLKHLSLSHFDPEVLVASLATISLLENLEKVELRENNLETHHFDLILRGLPSERQIDADFSGNKIDDEQFLGFLLSRTNKINSLKILQQQGILLNEETIKTSYLLQITLS